jgi:RND family efflux transporter MFP subunit
MSALRKVAWVVGLLAVCSLGPIALVRIFDGNGNPPAASSAPVRRAAPRAQAAATEPFVGVVRAGQAVEIAPKVEGKLETILFRPGDRVSRGKPLAQLDLRSLKQDLDVARAELTEANARLRDADVKLRRRRALNRFAAVAREELDEAKAQATMARAQVTAHRARVAQLEHNVDDGLLRSPFDGVVATCYASEGALVGPSRPVLRLISDGDVEVRFAIPEEHAREVSAGDRVRIELKTLKLVVHGVVRDLAPEVDSGSHMVFSTARLELDGAQRSLISSGTVARVTPEPRTRLPDSTVSSLK